jgi:hypothetical protein
MPKQTDRKKEAQRTWELKDWSSEACIWRF